MRITGRMFAAASAAVLLTLAVVHAQEPAAPPRGGGAGGQGRGGGGRGAPPAGQAPAVPHDFVTAAGRCGGARARPGALDDALHHLPRHAGARQRDGPEYHPDEDGQLRSLVVHARQRARAVPQGGASDPEREAERELHGRGNRGPRALPAPARQRHDARIGRSSPSATSSLATRRRARRISTGAGGCATCHNATTRNLAGIRTRIATPVDLQQRMLFPGGAGGRGRGGPGAGRRPTPTR